MSSRSPAPAIEGLGGLGRIRKPPRLHSVVVLGIAVTNRRYRKLTKSASCDLHPISLRPAAVENSPVGHIAASGLGERRGREGGGHKTTVQSGNTRRNVRRHLALRGAAECRHFLFLARRLRYSPPASFPGFAHLAGFGLAGCQYCP